MPYNENVESIFKAIAQERQEKPFVIRLTPTEHEQLGRLARCYKVKMAEVVRLLLHQAIVDYESDGEVFALSKY
jgi:hypothetical protein